MSTRKTREPQYQFEVEMAEKHGFARFGIMSNQTWRDDPRRLLFQLSRYKFVSKMLAGKRAVLEVGCADAFGTRLVLQEVGRVTAVDFDPIFVEDARDRMRTDAWPCEVLVHDMMEGPVAGPFDAAYSLDVFEHIPPAVEHVFLGNIARSLTPSGVMIIGSPSFASLAHASKGSLEGHVNCKTAPDLKRAMEKHFENVFIFSMNDEVVHTGYHQLAHYFFAVCAGRLTDAGTPR